MSRQIPILAAAALAMALAAPVCAATTAPSVPARTDTFRPLGAQLAQNESATPGVSTHASAQGMQVHKRHHRSSHHEHHSHASHSRHHNHHTGSAAADPKAAAEPAPAPTKGVVPKISP
jgi:hypothetical protein